MREEFSLLPHAATCSGTVSGVHHICRKSDTDTGQFHMEEQEIDWANDESKYLELYKLTYGLCRSKCCKSQTNRYFHDSCLLFAAVDRECLAKVVELYQTHVNHFWEA